MWAIVPLKSLEAAKQRLASVLTAAERRDLMLAMARDVLGALYASAGLSGILIVSRTTEADALAQAFSTERFAESPKADRPTALTQACDHLTGHLGARGAMIVPADVPLITAAEIDDLITGHMDHLDPDRRGVTVVPDRDNLGTNCLICSPPDIIGFVFDGKSFKPHVEAAFERGLTPRIVPSRGFALDIDTVDDLREVLALGSRTQTGTFLDKSGIAKRLGDLDNGEPEIR